MLIYRTLIVIVVLVCVVFAEEQKTFVEPEGQKVSNSFDAPPPESLKFSASRARRYGLFGGWGLWRPWGWRPWGFWRPWGWGCGCGYGYGWGWGK
uniref:Uncharacterized protein n=1 Tax=Steinernema glaseri TaxID=37863 RepID=A0A1I7ZWD3_9BILA